MRIIAFITARGMIEDILTHVRTRAAGASGRTRSPPAATRSS
jgi:hypothetical protein